MTRAARALLVAGVALLVGTIQIARSHGRLVGGTDESSYLTAAYEFLDGNGVQTAPVFELTKRPPVYPLLLAFGFRWTSHDAAWVLTLNLLSFVLLAVLTLRLGERCLSAPVGLVGALLVATHPTLAGFIVHPMAELVFAALLVAACALFSDAWKTERPAAAVAAGVALALSALAKPTASLFTAALLAGALLVAVLKREALLQKAAVGGLVLVSAFVTLAPWAIRNRIALGRWVLVSEYGPVHVALSVPFSGGVSGEDTPTGLDFNMAALDLRLRREPEVGKAALCQSAVSSYFAGRWDRIGTMIAAAPARLGFLLRLRRDSAAAWTDVVGFRLPFRPDWLIPFGLVALAASLAQRRAALWPVAAFPLFLIFCHSFLMALPRYRVPMVPFLMLLACEGIARLVRWRPA